MFARDSDKVDFGMEMISDGDDATDDAR